MSSLAQKTNNYRVEIRRRRVQDKISNLRATLLKNNNEEQNELLRDNQIQEIVKESLISKEKLFGNIGKIKSASFSISDSNIKLLVPLITNFCYVIGNIDKIRQQIQFNQDEDFIYNEVATILINISSNEKYEWPSSQYFPIIQNILKKERQTNTLWFLANILNQSKNTETVQALTKELLKYDNLEFCETRLKLKFENEQDIAVFTCYICSFLTNSKFLTLQEFRKLMVLIQSIMSLSDQTLDWYILQAIIDHAPYLSLLNYQMLHSSIITTIKQRYLLKKKSKMILKYLQFVKVYVYCEIDQAENLLRSNKLQKEQLTKVSKNNYERISLTTLPLLTICYQCRSPEVKTQLLEICILLVENYFAHIDLENQEIYLFLIANLSNQIKSPLFKFSKKCILWQIRYARILLEKIKSYKVSNQIIAEFLNENNILESIDELLRSNVDDIQMIREVSELCLLLFEDIRVQKNGSLQKNKNLLQEITKTYDLILNEQKVHDEELINKILLIIKLCELKNVN